MGFRKEMGNSCLTLEKCSGQKLGTVVLGKMLGIFKRIPFFTTFMFMGHCFVALGKLESPH